MYETRYYHMPKASSVMKQNMLPSFQWKLDLQTEDLTR